MQKNERGGVYFERARVVSGSRERHLRQTPDATVRGFPTTCCSSKERALRLAAGGGCDRFGADAELEVDLHFVARLEASEDCCRGLDSIVRHFDRNHADS